ncbi:hypothetical protein QUB07_08800 [Microcoleus sp. F8-C5]
MINSNRSCVLRNAIAPCFANIFPDDIPILYHKSQPSVLAYTSTQFRGLDILLKVFPEIRQAVPGTRLKVFSSMKVHQIDDNENQLFLGQLYRHCQETEGVAGLFHSHQKTHPYEEMGGEGGWGEGQYKG